MQRQRQLLSDGFDVASQMRRDHMPIGVATTTQAYLQRFTRKREARECGPPRLGGGISQV